MTDFTHISHIPTSSENQGLKEKINSGNRFIFFYILVPPLIDGANDVTDSAVVINSPLELECQATGSPAPVIT